MVIYKHNEQIQNTQKHEFFYSINDFSKKCVLHDIDVHYFALLPDEIIEQCLNLVEAILDNDNPTVKESLTLILEERLLLLKNKLT